MPPRLRAGSGDGGAKAREVWFRRKRRRAQLDLSPLDRLSELIERIVALLPEQPAAAAVVVEATAEPFRPSNPRPPASAELLFVPSPVGYRLVAAEGRPCTRGAIVVLPEGAFRVLRVGPSPLPGDPRRCAFLETQEQPGGPRTSDA